MTAALASTAGPASAQVLPGECMVSNGGRLLAASGDAATLGGSASNTRVPLAHQVYIDHDPVTGFRFRSLTTAAVLCNLDARRAEIVGTGQVTTQAGVQQLVQYRIAVFDASNPALNDFYRITLSNGYDSGEQPVVHGNVNVMAR